MRKIKTTQPSFSGLIGGDYLYVDKTRTVHDLLSREEDFYFLSRPRRYGKSLFCSTLHALSTPYSTGGGSSSKGSI